MYSKRKKGGGKISNKGDYVMRECSLFQTTEILVIS